MMACVSSDRVSKRGDDIQQFTSMTRTGENEWVKEDIVPMRFVPLPEDVVTDEC